jgi:protein-tyrosine phosphatase
VERQIELEGCHNFRDLGGYPAAGGRSVRWRTLFRADGLHDLTARDVERLRGELGLGEVLDLRSSGEVELDGRGLLAQHQVRIRHLPLFDGRVSRGSRPPPGLSLGQLYLLTFERAGEAFARVLTALAEARAPAVFHCSAGKDRTGMVSALVLGLLGVEDEVVVADYAATREHLDAIVARLTASRGYDGVFAALPPETLHAEPRTMLELLAGLRERWGGARGYARAVGVSDESVERLRGRLLE